MWRTFPVLVLAVLALLIASTIPDRSVYVYTQRPARWAQPATLPAVANFFQVTPTLYRGALPDEPGYGQLKSMGIRTVVDLRASQSDEAEVRRAGLRRVSAPVSGVTPTDEQIAAALRAITDPSLQPVFVHCQVGMNRTGVVMAAYRVVVQDWPRDEAVAEMAQGGFGWRSDATEQSDYIQRLDAQAMRLRIATPPQP